jgi:hypothetical protein
MEMIMRTIKLALGALALMPLTACDSSETNNGATTKAPAALHAIGEVVPAGTLEIAVTSVTQAQKAGSTPYADGVGPNETLVIVRYNVTNKGSAAIEQGDLPTVELLDANGAVLSEDPVNGAIAAVEAGADPIAGINPGVTFKSAKVWKVAKGAFDPATWKVVVRTDPAIDFKLK